MTDEQLTISTLIAKATSLRRNERGAEGYLLEKTAETLARVTTDRDRYRTALERISAVTFTVGPEYGLMLARIAIEALQEAEG